MFLLLSFNFMELIPIASACTYADLDSVLGDLFNVLAAVVAYCLGL